MADKTELLRLPQSDSTSLVLPAAGVNLIARGRREATSLLFQKGESRCVAKVMFRGKWGFIGKDGKFVVEPKYTRLMSFHCGLVSFSCSSGRNVTWGYLDHCGREIVPERFGPASFSWRWDFVDGLAVAKVNGKFGYIRKDGDFAIEPIYDHAHPFVGGAACVEIAGKHRFIERGGRYIGAICDSVATSEIHSAKSATCANIGSKWGFINCRGEFLIEPRFEQIHDLRVGWAVHDGTWLSIVDRSGKNIFESLTPGGETAHPYINPKDVIDCFESAEVIVIAISSTMRCLVNFDGYEVFRWNPQVTVVDVLDDFKDGVCLVKTFQDSRVVSEWTQEDLDSADVSFFLDKRGKQISDKSWYAVGGFQDGRGVIEHNGKYGYIDNTGSLVTRIEYLDAQPFMGGYALILDDDSEWRWINRDGAIVESPEFEENGDLHLNRIPYSGYLWLQGYGADSFHEGLCKFRTDEVYGFVDTRCQVAIPPTFQDAEPFSNGVAAVKDNQGKWGYIDKAGDIVIPCQFEAAKRFEIIDAE